MTYTWEHFFRSPDILNSIKNFMSNETYERFLAPAKNLSDRDYANLQIEADTACAEFNYELEMASTAEEAYLRENHVKFYRHKENNSNDT